jgi:PAS domain S-box-containing protein
MAAEEARRATTADVELYFENALDLLSIADTDGYFRRLNPAWETTLGYPVAELEGRRFLDLVHPDDLESTRHKIGELAELARSGRLTPPARRRTPLPAT